MTQLCNAALEMPGMARAHAACLDEVVDLIRVRLAQDGQMVVALLHEGAQIPRELPGLQPRPELVNRRALIAVVVVERHVEAFCLAIRGWGGAGVRNSTHGLRASDKTGLHAGVRGDLRLVFANVWHRRRATQSPRHT